METFQASVRAWVSETFSAEVANSPRESQFRFLEESLELVQALGLSREEVFTLVNVVYNKPLGDPRQELGGVMVTLARLANVQNFNMKQLADRELSRIRDPQVQQRIRDKQEIKRAAGVGV